MKRLRSIVFWCHLATALVAGIVVLVMSVTGVLLTYQKQVTAWADKRAYPVTSPSGAEATPSPERALQKALASGDGVPTTLTVRADPNAALEVAYGRERTLLVNPYTGAALGDADTGVRRFFQVMLEWHRWLGAAGERRDIGKAVTGASNLGFLFLVVSGIYLWCPRHWSRASVRGVALFRRGLSGKARDSNWHTALGFWCCLPLAGVVLSAVVISYPWASDLVYRAAGEKPPVGRGPGGPGGGGPAPGKGEHGRAAEQGRPEGRGEQAREGQPAGQGERGRPSEGRPAAPVSAEGLDRAWTRAVQESAGWRSIRVDLAATSDEVWTFAIDRGSGGQPQLVSGLTVDRETGKVVERKPYSANSTGQRARAFLRFAHTGEVAGLLGQTLAGIASAAAAVLVWTGIALTWRRFAAWRARRRRAPRVGAAAPER